MVATPRSAAELTRLTPAEKRVSEYLVAGHSNEEAARELGMNPGTYSGHLGNIGRKFHVTARPARAHAVLASGQVEPPPAPEAAPHLTDDERRLLRAVAEHSTTHDIARAAYVAQADVRLLIKNLVDKTGADNDTHLIGLAHAWGLLGTAQQAVGSRLPHAGAVAR
ncbi:LuxR C-terminal-related transcriptional regulator [Streptomyces noursei]|uniref:LuxR C-terminal-related transcriptional regulator n=1 Tax=Streptomyces noursei TaxID=1971 RepID=UPI0016789E54|nr:LuxR C-terminal-related transcriptional regulator [Streptomyces noursei]MCZ1021338.1 LuxR C-terminal-related transcriptional regulator [Streptomyces noursei]